MPIYSGFFCLHFSIYHSKSLFDRLGLFARAFALLKGRFVTNRRGGAGGFVTRTIVEFAFACEVVSKC